MTPARGVQHSGLRAQGLRAACCTGNGSSGTVLALEETAANSQPATFQMVELEEEEQEEAEEEDLPATAVSTSGHDLPDPADPARPQPWGSMLRRRRRWLQGCCMEGMMPRAEWQQCCPMPTVWAVAGPVLPL